jgi:glutathione S-transferase
MSGIAAYDLYVIPGSHACRAAMLMLAHKRVPYRRHDIVTLTHPAVAAMLGFDSGGQTRTAGGKRTFGLRFGDRLGTVPGLAAGRERISTNYGIARFLDERHPEAPLLPPEATRRRAVEEAEAWGNETLQMAARRIIATAALRDPAGFAKRAGAGRMGPLLYKHELTRRIVVPHILGQVFLARPAEDAELLAELEAMLDRIDTWIGAGVLGGPETNVGDCMIAPSLALILYRPDVQPLFAGRPALELVDRLLPEPAGR